LYRQEVLYKLVYYIHLGSWLIAFGRQQGAQVPK